MRSYLHSLLMAGLFVSGLVLWLSPDRVSTSALVLWIHVAGGFVLAALLMPWLWGHITQGLRRSQRRVFKQSSWALLALWLVVIFTGLLASLPAILWLAGHVWFPAREVSESLSLLHYWSSWGAMAGLGLHLALRHWV